MAEIRPNLAADLPANGTKRSYRKGELTYLSVLAIRGVKETWQDDHTFVIDRLVHGPRETSGAMDSQVRRREARRPL
jgi:hypothetical protein